MSKDIIFYMPNIERGGIEKNLNYLTEFFYKKKINVNLVTHNYNKKSIKNIINKIQIFGKSKFNFKNRYIASLVTLITLIKLLLKKKNIKYIFSFQSHPIPIFVSALFGKKCIIRIANHPISSLKYYDGKLVIILKIYIKKIFYKFAYRIICNSNASKNYIKKINTKTLCIYNPIKLKKKKSKLNKKRDGTLLFVGRLDKQKNVIGILKMMKILKEKNIRNKLIIIGDGPEKKNILEFVKINNLKKNVILKGYINPNKFYKSSSVLILNSFFEGMPNVLLEGLYNQIPIVSSDCESGPREILKNQKYGYMSPINDQKKLTEKVLFVLSNQAEALKKSKLGYLSLARFNYEKQCEKYFKLLNF